MSNLNQGYLIKLNATDSTNTYLKSIMLTHDLEDYTTVLAQKQLKGRGQRGTAWQSEEGKNLTFSVLKKNESLKSTDQFLLNMAVSLAVYDTLEGFNIPDIHIKWPNDILSGQHKLCGILIENILLGTHIKASVIGIGLNVNQIAFHGLPKVSSLQLITGKPFDVDMVLQAVLNNLKKQLLSLNREALTLLYERLLFRKDKLSSFKDVSGTIFMGFIRGISAQGKLLVEQEGAEITAFDLKEIQLLY